ncbi:MAG: GNAT family N-acetyltransferase [Bacteroidota bacterium]
MFTLSQAQSKEAFEIAKHLFKEYAEELGIDLSFQNFAKELEEVEHEYAPPHGALFLAFVEQKEAIACFAIRNWEREICELKRMYIRKAFRGQGLGKVLLKKSIEQAEKLGYHKMRLDTLPSMQAAIKLYESMGFVEIEAYRFNPIPGTKYFEKSLI